MKIVDFRDTEIGIGTKVIWKRSYGGFSEGTVTGIRIRGNKYKRTSLYITSEAGYYLRSATVNNYGTDNYKFKNLVAIKESIIGS